MSQKLLRLCRNYSEEAPDELLGANALSMLPAAVPSSRFTSPCLLSALQATALLQGSGHGQEGSVRGTRQREQPASPLGS